MSESKMREALERLVAVVVKRNCDGMEWGDNFGELMSALGVSSEALAHQPAVKDAVGGDEPFGYFRTEAFGWTDCGQDDVGAKPLYARPQTSQLNLDYLREMGRLEARIRELEQASAAVPEGYALAPIVSTTAMDLAGVAASEHSISRGMADEIWAAMLAASQPEVK